MEIRWGLNLVRTFEVIRAHKRNKRFEQLSMSMMNIGVPRHDLDHGFSQSAPTPPDLSEWEQRPRTQIVSEKAAAASPYLAGSDRRPRHVRTLRRWRKAHPARGPSFLKIGGRYFYTIGALRDFYQRCVRGES